MGGSVGKVVGSLVGGIPGFLIGNEYDKSKKAMKEAQRQEAEAQRKEAERIKEERATALEKRKQLIDNQRYNLLGNNSINTPDKNTRINNYSTDYKLG